MQPAPRYTMDDRAYLERAAREAELTAQRARQHLAEMTLRGSYASPHAAGAAEAVAHARMAAVEERTAQAIARHSERQAKAIVHGRAALALQAPARPLDPPAAAGAYTSPPRGLVTSPPPPPATYSPPGTTMTSAGLYRPILSPTPLPPAVAPAAPTVDDGLLLRHIDVHDASPTRVRVSPPAPPPYVAKLSPPFPGGGGSGLFLAPAAPAVPPPAPALAPAPMHFVNFTDPYAGPIFSPPPLEPTAATASYGEAYPRCGSLLSPPQLPEGKGTRAATARAARRSPPRATDEGTAVGESETRDLDAGASPTAAGAEDVAAAPVAPAAEEPQEGNGGSGRGGAEAAAAVEDDDDELVVLQEAGGIPAGWTATADPVDRTAEVKDVMIAVKRTNTATLTETVEDVSDPKGPKYQQYMQAGAMRPTAEHTAVVKEWIAAHGAEVAREHPHGDYVKITATVGQLEAMAGVEFTVYRHENGLEVQRGVGAVRVPRRVARAVDTFSGFQGFPIVGLFSNAPAVVPAEAEASASPDAAAAEDDAEKGQDATAAPADNAGAEPTPDTSTSGNVAAPDAADAADAAPASEEVKEEGEEGLEEATANAASAPAADNDGDDDELVVLQEAGGIPAGWTATADPVDRTAEVKDVMIAVKRTNTATLTETVEDVSDPKGPKYQQYMQAGAMRPTAEHTAVVKEWIAAHGAEVAREHPHGDYVKITATVGQLEAMAGVEFTVYRHENGLEVQRGVGAVRVPRRVARAVDTFSGFQGFPIAVDGPGPLRAVNPVMFEPRVKAPVAETEAEAESTTVVVAETYTETDPPACPPVAYPDDIYKPTPEPPVYSPTKLYETRADDAPGYSPKRMYRAAAGADVIDEASPDGARAYSPEAVYSRE